MSLKRPKSVSNHPGGDKIEKNHDFSHFFCWKICTVKNLAIPLQRFSAHEDPVPSWAVFLTPCWKRGESMRREILDMFAMRKIDKQVRDKERWFRGSPVKIPGQVKRQIKKHNESVKAEREGLVAVVLDKRSCVFSREKRQDNINTTKSLILAQDER